jgi:hypothetical protein
MSGKFKKHSKVDIVLRFCFAHTHLVVVVDVVCAQMSFVAYSKDSHFPIENLPYGVFRRNTGTDQHAHHSSIGVAIGLRARVCCVLRRVSSLARARALSCIATMIATKRIDRRSSARLARVRCAQTV